jgi:hypothetical protein
MTAGRHPQLGTSGPFVEHRSMTTSPTREDPSETKYMVELFLLGGGFDLLEDGKLIAALGPEASGC